LSCNDRLFAERGRATKDRALRTASELGLDTARLEKDMHDQAVEDAIAANKRLADRLGVRGVPFYLVGDRPLPGSGDNLYAELAAGVADVRQHGCRAVC
jgi:protein-disulfide isomerase